MKKVWSVTINGKNDCVIMDDAQAMIIKMKYMPDIEIYDMTERHGMKPQHLHKLLRKEQAEFIERHHTITKGIGTGQYGGAAPVCWEFEDLVNA